MHQLQHQPMVVLVQVLVLVVQAGHQRRADWIVWMRPSLSFTRSM